MRLKKGQVEDIDQALDLRKMSRLIDRVGEVFEEEGLTADEAVWAAALNYLSVYNATDAFANPELLGSAARALLKEAVDVFESLPEPGEEDADPQEPDEAEEADEEGEEEDDEEDEDEPDGEPEESADTPHANE